MPAISQPDSALKDNYNHDDLPYNVCYLYDKRENYRLINKQCVAALLLKTST